MDKNTKSILKVVGVSLFALIVVFGILYAAKSGKAHRHGDGDMHSH